jgi:hypothetical protein
VAHGADNLINRVLNAICSGFGWSRLLKIKSGSNRFPHVIEGFLRHELQSLARVVLDFDEAMSFR